MRLVTFFLFSICLAGMGCAPRGSTKASKVIGIGDFDLDSFKGKVVLVNFWATWCGPCKVEMPAMLKLHENFDQQKVAIVGVSIDDKRTPEQDTAEIKSFVERYKISYTIVHDREAKLARAFGGIRAIPTSILIDQKGVIQKTYMGVRPYENFAQDIETLLRRS
jgi:thiol-disulfide isomerase/thioredoxin